MKNTVRLIICLCALAAFFSARAEPPPLTLYFDFFYNDIHAAKIRETFTVNNGEYVIESHAAAQGLAKILYGDVYRKSIGKFVGATNGKDVNKNDESNNENNYKQSDRGELHTRRYETKRGRRPLQIAVFDGVHLDLQKGDETRRENAPAEILLDYLTALYRPYALQKPTAGKVALTDGWRLKIYEYTVGEEEEVQTPLGNILAVPLVRESPRGRRVFWVAPQMQYIPVKFYIENKGHVFETILTGINQEPTDDKNNNN